MLDFFLGGGGRPPPPVTAEVHRDHPVVVGEDLQLAFPVLHRRSEAVQEQHGGSAPRGLVPDLDTVQLDRRHPAILEDRDASAAAVAKPPRPDGRSPLRLRVIQHAPPWPLTRLRRGTIAPGGGRGTRSGRPRPSRATRPPARSRLTPCPWSARAGRGSGHPDRPRAPGARPRG